MLRALILILSSFVADGTDRVNTICTADACLTLHLEKLRFQNASETCINNGGNLVTMRSENEFHMVKSVLSAAAEEDDSIRHSKLWIGLTLKKSRCTDANEELHGFRWTSKPEDTKYSKWIKKPLSTCTEKRCVSIGLADDLRWTDGSCKDHAFYMCKFLSKGMCKPIVLEEGDVKYNLPFLSKPLTQNEKLAMLPHGTWAEIRCGTAETFISLCKDDNGPFDWTNSELFCARNKRSCKHSNGGCDHICSETEERVYCKCRSGYYLMDDKVTCAHNCENSPCEFKCVPTPTGFSCACAEGYRLAGDRISCVDINECHHRVCGEHKCHNTQGSYFCECKPGFRHVAGRCEDVDECTESRCMQGCLNSHGSFSCYCYAGYTQSSDYKGTCMDIDECGYTPCEDICNNTVGSYKCSCRENFILAANGISCLPDPTKLVQNTSPDHKETFISTSSQLPVSFGASTVNPPQLNKTNTDSSSKPKESFLGISWILVCALGAVIPLLLLIVIASVFVIYKCKSSRKASKKNATADSYCWVSSGLEKEQKIQLNNEVRNVRNVLSAP